MNYTESREKLKDISDNDVINYYHNPTPDVPMFLSLSELQRRKRVRESYEANKPEEKSVAEKLVEEVQPQMAGVVGLPEAQPMMQAMAPPPEMPMQQMAQGGLAELDTGDMFDEANYASGGIVAFDDGGEVQHFEQGGTSRIGDFFKSRMDKYDIDRKINALMEEKNKYRFDYTGLYKPEERAAIESKHKDIDTEIANLKAQRSGAPVTPSAPPGPNVMGSQAAANAMTGMQYDPSQALNIKGPPLAAKPAGDGTDPYALEKVKGIGDYAKELQDYIGVDPARAGLQERLSKMDTKAAKMEEQAPWLAVARAGFEMANQRPEFGKAAETPFASLARGAGAGLKDYVESRDKLTSLEEKRFGIANEIARVDRAEKIAVAKFGADSKQAVEEANRKAKLQRAHDNVLMTMNREDNDVRLKAAAAKTGMDPKQILDAKEKIRSGNPTYINWVNEMTKKSKNIINTPEFKRAEENLVNELVLREASLSGASTIDTTGWKLR